MSLGPTVSAPPRALHVVSVSLGSASRDHHVELVLLGRHVIAERIVRSVGRRRREILFTVISKAALLADRAAPWLVDWGVRRAAARVRSQAR